jgi:hypothetical protein
MASLFPLSLQLRTRKNEMPFPQWLQWKIWAGLLLAEIGCALLCEPIIEARAWMRWLAISGWHAPPTPPTPLPDEPHSDEFHREWRIGDSPEQNCKIWVLLPDKTGRMATSGDFRWFFSCLYSCIFFCLSAFSKFLQWTWVACKRILSY